MYRERFSSALILLSLRYCELEARYGKLDPLADVDFGEPDDVVQVLISFEDGKPDLYPVCLHWTVNDLYAQLEPSFKPSLRRSHIIYHTDATYGFSDPMKQYERTMRGYAVKDGDSIDIVERLDWKKRQEEKAKKNQKSGKQKLSSCHKSDDES